MSKRKSDQKLNFRAAPIPTKADGAPATLDEKSRSVEVVAATENPVEIYDFERMEIVSEVLLMAGIEMPKSRQMVLLDSHSRFDTSSVIGSIREMAVQGGELIGRVFFAADAESVFRKVADGHISDVSIGYRVVESVWIPEGETQKIKGRTFEGPLKVATRWRPKELSAVPIGADEFSKVRIEGDQTLISNKKEVEIDQMEREEIIKKERERIAEIRGMCRTFNCEDLAQNMIEKGTDLADARAVVLERAAAIMQSPIGVPGPGYDPYHHPATIQRDQTDKRVDAQVDGLLLRAGMSVENPAPGSNEYRNFTFLDHARECLRAQGIRAMGSPNQIFRQALESRALTTGDLPYILGNYANKSTLLGYNEATSAITSICREIPAKDFKAQHLVKLSESDSLEEVPENSDFQYGRREEFHESYQLATYGKIFSCSRQSLINDDLGTLSDTTKKHGIAAARKVRDVILSVLTGNAAMSDGKALFHADHSNYVASGSGDNPDATSLGAAYKAMRVQTGPQGAVLGIQPKYLIVPAALEIDSGQLLLSTGDLADNKSSGVANWWHKRLELVPEPALDGNSVTGWYLAADQRVHDTIVLSFLNGQNKPEVFTRDGWTVDGTEFKVRIDVAAKAADWTGLYFNYGA